MGQKARFFLFESPAPHSRDHLKNKHVASGDVRLYHVEEIGAQISDEIRYEKRISQPRCYLGYTLREH